MHRLGYASSFTFAGVIAAGSLAYVGASLSACSSPSASPTSLAPSAATNPALATTQPTAPRYEAASAVVEQGSRCGLHAEGTDDPAEVIPVDADVDGVARFSSIRPDPAQPGAVERLALDCTNVDGTTKTYPVDLRAAATFAPRPLDLSGLRVRPALEGDPMRYTQKELIDEGYGLRPDPARNPAGYARWLATAKTEGHELRPVRMAPPPAGLWPAATRSPSLVAAAAPSAAPVHVEDVSLSTSARPWTGAVLEGSYSVNQSNPALTTGYGWIDADFYLPTLTPSTTTGVVQSSVWAGLDWSNLLQAEVWMYAATSAGSSKYSLKRQVFAPYNGSAPLQGAYNGITFSPAAGDEIYDAVWWCDAQGNPDLAGGYGCTFVMDITQQGAFWSCDTASNSTCASYYLQPGDLANGNLGQTAEFVLESDTGQISPQNSWPIFSTFTMSGSADVYESGTTWVASVNPATDPNVKLETDWTVNVPFPVNVSLVGPEVQWSVVPWQATAPAPSELRGIGSNMCLDVIGGATTEGARVQIWPCTGGMNQLWKMSVAPGGQATVVGLQSGMCLDAVGRGTTAGTPLQIWPCNGGSNQAWTVETQYLTNQGSVIVGAGSNLCLTVDNGSTAEGSQLELGTCQGEGASDQLWAVTAENEVQGPGGNCINVVGNSTTPGARTEIRQCTGVPSELWTMSGQGVIQGTSGLCLDALAEGTTPGTPVQVYTCNGGANQEWVWNNGRLQGVQSGLCLNTVGNGTGVGTQLELDACGTEESEDWWTLEP